jgi:hypothetical protein
MLTILSGVAEFECEIIRERTLLSMASFGSFFTRDLNYNGASMRAFLALLAAIVSPILHAGSALLVPATSQTLAFRNW